MPSSPRSPRSRRQFLRTAGLALGAWSLPVTLPRRRRAHRMEASTLNAGRLTVARVDRTTVRLPFREVPRRAMDRELPHWRYSEICEVHLRSGDVGLGETLLFYTWGATDDTDVERALGNNAAALLWDDSLGAGLQAALFDAVARAQGIPIHRLLGRQVHERTPLSWWNIDTPADDMASECKTAFDQGYLSYKTKGRPWFDIWDQVEKSRKVVPETFKIDMDFNETLLDAKRALPIVKDLESVPQIDIYESPIPQRDVEGNRAIREATRVNIALHYGTPPPDVVVREGVCDGFVVGGGASRVLEQGRFAGEVKMPFWLQLVGTGITAAYSLHFGAILREARWPAVNCHQLYTHSMLEKSIAVENGTAAVPNGPGLGYTLDRTALERFRVDKPSSLPNPKRMVEARWPDGRRMYFANGPVNFVLRPGMEGKIPFYERGVTTRLFPDDGSESWSELYERARKDGPFILR